MVRHLESTRWTIDYAIRAEVMELMCEELKGCKRFLELGAGYSSVCLREICADVTSFDHDIEYAECVERYMWISDLSNPHSCLEPLHPNPHVGLLVDMKMGMRIWGNTHHLGRYDGILVDHGPEMTDRLHDIHTIVKCLAPGGVIILDDYKGGYKRGVIRRMPGFHIQTHRSGSRHWGVAIRTGGEE